MRTTSFILTSALLLLCAPAWGQDWLLDDSLKELGRVERDRLLSDVKRAPQRALQTILQQEADHLEALHKDELEAFGKEAWKRLLAGREEGRLWKAIGEELKTSGVYTKALLRKVWQEERSRLYTFDERIAYALVDRALRAVLIDRLRDLQRARLKVARLERTTGDGRGAFPLDQPHQLFSWRATPRDAKVDVSSDLPLPRVDFWSQQARFRKALVDQRWKTKLGDVRVTAAEVVGLAHAKAGTVKYKDEWGREVEGLGATFTARARFTAARGQFTSKQVGEVKNDLGVRARVYAMAQELQAAEVSAGAVVSEKGLGAHGQIKVGAGSEARVRVPITIDLKVIRLRVTPYASANVGVSAEAHASFEVEWTGKLRLDLGASVSKGIGAGAGVLIEVELGPVVRRYLSLLIRKLERIARPVADFFMGRSWKGPPVPTDKLTLTLDDLERRAAEAPRPATPAPTRHAEVARRYAPVIYQRIKRGRFDLLRRIDYDGDWSTLNNWDHATPREQAQAYVYYDVKETPTHYFVTYGFYHAGRKSNAAIGFLRNMRRHENDLGGCIVVVRKRATPGREVEALITCHDGHARIYSGLARRNGKKTRWRRRDGRWSGTVQFVDEVDHPLVDLDRTHPQVWIDGKGHDVYGFTGRDDARPFGDEEGVVYVARDAAQAPRSYRDPQVGYALLPLWDLVGHLDDPQAFTVDRTILADRAFRPLPRRMRGDEGPNDRAVPPWAWRVARKEADRHGKPSARSHRQVEVVPEGEVFIDPARSLATLFSLPKDFSRVYTHNPWLKDPVRKARVAAGDEELGLVGNVR